MNVSAAKVLLSEDSAQNVFLPPTVCNERLYDVYSVKYDDDADAFEVVHIDDDDTRVKHIFLETFVFLVGECPLLKHHLLEAMTNCENAGGYKIKTKPVRCDGAVSTRKRKRQTVFPFETDCFAGSSLGPIKHRHADQFCSELALMNVLDASPEFAAEFQAKYVEIHKHNGAFSDFKSMNNVCQRLSIQLKKIWCRKNPQTIWHLLRLKNGKYLVEFGVHVVAIDSQKKVLYDCAAMDILPLTEKSFSNRSLGIVTDLYLVMDNGRKNKLK